MAAAARSAHHASTSETPASVITKSAVFKLGIHPSAMHDALGGAKELLDGMLMRHHHQLGGGRGGRQGRRVVSARVSSRALPASGNGFERAARENAATRGAPSLRFRRP